MCRVGSFLGVLLAGAIGLTLIPPNGVAQQPDPHLHHDHAAPPVERDPNRLWCGAHGVYEDECYICHPELKKKDDGHDHDHDHGGGHGMRGDVLWCNEHNLAEMECGICQPQLAAKLLPGQSMKLRLPSRDSATKAGIRVARPRPADMASAFNVYCDVHYNQNRLARITPLVTGVIQRVHADVGQVVSAGDLLAEIASPEVAAAKRDYLVALVSERLKKLEFERERQLAEKDISAVQNVQQAEAKYEMARIGTLSAHQKLINYGFTEKEAREVAETRSSTSIVHVHAPFDGSLVERSAVLGEAVKPGSKLFILADLSTMWLTLSVPESRIGLVRLGLPVEVTFSSLPGVVAKGSISWIAPAVSQRSRMVGARALVDNSEGLLRDNMFGEARILLDAATSALSVSANAIQEFERVPFVFVRIDEDLFDVRRVSLGNRSRDRVQILEGIREDDSVVVTGSFTMMSEFLKSRLGAGCVDD